MSREYAIDTILPKREVHIFAGPSGAGKTRLLFQWLEDWIHSKPILGYDSNPSGWMYVSADRSLDGCLATLDSLKSPLLNSHLSNFHSLVTHRKGSKQEARSTDGLMGLIKTHLKPGDVCFVDGFQSLCPSGKVNDYAIVADWLTMLTRYCTQNNLTIVGLGHSGKVKKNEEYSNPRQRVMGNNAWGAYSETIIVLDTPEPEKQPNLRKLYVMARQAPPIILPLAFNDKGRLVEEEQEVSQMAMNAWLSKLGAGEEFTTKQATEYGESMGLHRATVFRWLGEMKGRGVIQKQKHGTYVVSFQQ